MTESLQDPISIRFNVVSRPGRIPSTGRLEAYLLEDRWDDWGRFATLYHLSIYDDKGEKHELGDVKIGQFGLKGASALEAVGTKKRRPDVPRQFSQLGDTFFSLGQDETYYESLGKFRSSLKNAITRGLCDVVADPALWRRALDEEVMGESLLRFVLIKSVEEQFRRLLAGGAKLTPYSFTYIYPKRTGSGGPPLELTFRVRPESFPPTNIHVIIGRNGVGKTYGLNLMTNALVGEPSSARQSGQFTGTGDDTKVPFANLVSVSFSAFDDFAVMPEKRDKSEGIQYAYIGLKRIQGNEQNTDGPKSPEMLATEFVKSVRPCLRGRRAARWRRALKTLEADPNFKDAEVSILAANNNTLDELEEDARRVFGRLSSGHKIVLLTMTRLVETVDEKTLILLDEPEAHLHPPLLSAFIRSLSDLLINRNGVAIIATHSPVVLQEVPKECVWKLRRTGLVAVAERPESETFGENVGVLTREVFGLEVAQSGFHKLLNDAVETNASFDEAVSQFDEKLGAEARAILRGLFTAKEQPKQ